MKDKTILSCFFSSPRTEKFTVGEIKDLKCESKQSLFLQPSQELKIEFKDKQKEYSLFAVRTAKIEDKKIHLKVTSYKTGEYKNTHFTIIGGGGKSFLAEGLSWSTVSVLKPGVEMKPHPAYGPWAFSFPAWYFFAWGGLFFILLALAGAALLRWRRREKILARVKQRLQGNKTPVQYFIETIQPFFINRGEALKSPLFFQEIERALREFLENKFLIPLEAPRRKVIKRLREKKTKEDKIKALCQILIEFEKNSSVLKTKTGREVNFEGDRAVDSNLAYGNSAGVQSREENNVSENVEARSRAFNMPPLPGSRRNISGGGGMIRAEDKEQLLDMVRDFVFEREK